jgi:hypothetical protein
VTGAWERAQVSAPTSRDAPEEWGRSRARTG